MLKTKVRHTRYRHIRVARYITECGQLRRRWRTHLGMRKCHSYARNVTMHKIYYAPYVEIAIHGHRKCQVFLFLVRYLTL